MLGDSYHVIDESDKERLMKMKMMKMTCAGPATPTTAISLRTLMVSVATRGINTERLMAGLLISMK